MTANPLVRLPRIDRESGRRRKRRALTPDEVLRLLGESGPRELVYRVALGTGLRAGELRKLQWGDVRLDDGRPRLELRAEATKARRADTIPLTADLALRLGQARPAGVESGVPVFPRVPRTYTFDRDCTRAGIVTHDETGALLVGFHSLRVTFVSELQRAGVNPRTLMELARHRDYKLTATVYTDLAVIDPFGAVRNLPSYGDAKPSGSKRTGSD